MNTLTFDKLLINTAFCCMACDGNIDKQEIDAIKTMCNNSLHFTDFNFEEELNFLVKKLNNSGKQFLNDYFEFLKNSKLTEQDELDLIEFAIGTLKADETLGYSEIKFFKVIRSHLKVSNDKVLQIYPDIEAYLEEDIITDSYLENITKKFIESIDLPKFEMI